MTSPVEDYERTMFESEDSRPSRFRAFIAHPNFGETVAALSLLLFIVSVIALASMYQLATEVPR